MPTRRVALLLAVFALACKPSRESRPLLLVSTTSTQDSGLFDRLQPAAEKAIGRRIALVAVGSGEALKHAERGDADVVISHSPAAEETEVAAGHLIDRAPLMWNRFLLLGPKEDPAKVKDATDVLDAMRRIRSSGALFVSRGDESGTHSKERELWKAAGLEEKNPNVLPTGQGQGETIVLAAQKSAYVLCDSSTWAKQRSTSHLLVVFDPGPHGPVNMINAYHVMRENPALHPSAEVESSKKFLEWIEGPEAQALISSGGLFTFGSPQT